MLPLTIAALAVSPLAWAPALHAQAPPKDSGVLEVTGPARVIDGDTLEIYVDGRRTAIGIIGITVPRVDSRCGRQAAELLSALVNGSDAVALPVTLRFEEDEAITFDARKRRMYHLTLPGGASVGAELVRAGLADVDGSAPDRVELTVAAGQASRCVE